MVKSVEGVYRDGKVELMEPIAEAEGSRVIVTLVHLEQPVDLRERGIDELQAADLRVVAAGEDTRAQQRALLRLTDPGGAPGKVRPIELLPVPDHER